MKTFVFSRGNLSFVLTKLRFSLGETICSPKGKHVSEKTRTSFFKNKKAVSSLPPDTAFHLSLSIKKSATRLDLLEEVIALVIYQDKRGEVLYLDLPDRFHTQFRIFHALDALDIVLRQDRRRATDRS